MSSTPNDQEALVRARSRERRLLTGIQLARLGELLENPTVYVHRSVEELSFLPDGGQSWTRTLQVMIPDIGSRDSSSSIISLGMFERRRFADFKVFDAGGQRLNLLTRFQHGIALTHVALKQYFNKAENTAIRNARRRVADATESSPASEHDKAVAAAYDLVLDLAYALATEMAPSDESQDASESKGLSSDAVRAIQLGASLEVLIEALEQHPEASCTKSPKVDEITKLIEKQFFDLQRVAQYLCWVDAEAGDVVTVTASYTMRDARLGLASRGSFGGWVKSAVEATRWTAEVDEGGQRSPDVGERKVARQRVRMAAYRAVGLAPLNYRIYAPAHDHAGSYYFLMKAPQSTQITYLDWGTDYSFTDLGGVVDCSSPTVHFNNSSAHRLMRALGPDEKDCIPDSKIRAYLRATPTDHKKIALAAFLNLVFVALLSAGRFSDSPASSVQEWLLLSPTVLLAFIAQQQRHYYARATRQQRFALWLYLIISVSFLVIVVFSFATTSDPTDKWGFFAAVSAFLMAVSSAAIIVWYAPLGERFNRTTETRFRRNRAGREASREESPTHLTYDRQVLRYCDWVISRSVIAAVLVGALFIASLFAWDGSKFSWFSSKPVGATAGSGTTTAFRPKEPACDPSLSWLSAVCTTSTP
jgi:hypothetical protein